jgi:hypothetical protein
VFEIVQPKANDFSGPRDWQCVCQSAQWPPGRTRRLPGKIGDAFKIAINPAQQFAEIVGHICICNL